jgi:hypothetical protein
MMHPTPRTDAMTENHPSWPATAGTWARTLEQEAAISADKLKAVESLAIELSLAVLRTANPSERRRIESQLTELQYAGLELNHETSRRY